MAVHYRNDSTLGYKEAVASTSSANARSEARSNSSSDATGANDISSITASLPDAISEHPRNHSVTSTISTAPTSPKTAPRKSRVNLACKRCKRRKQRCDGTQPCCRSCERAGMTCAYEKTVRPQYPGGKALYISALEERIAFLEARMPDQHEDHLVNDSTHLSKAIFNQSGGSLLAPQTTRRESTDQSPKNFMSDDVVEADDRSSLVDGVAYLSLCASGTTDATSEPYYIGSTSGATIARVIQSSIFKSAGSRINNEAPSRSERQQAEKSSPPTPPASSRSDAALSALPELEQARMLFDTFFERIHTRWPLLDRVVYEGLFMKQYLPDALSVVERSIFHLIYAITARFLSLTRKLHSVDPEHHLMAATEPMACILEQHSLATLQFLVLLGVHGQRSPYGAGAWSQVRYATSVCIEMGLHRKQTRITSVEQARDVEIRRRIFWSCYCLDRSTSIVLGRPFAISDRDINVELPSAGGQFWSLTHKEPRDPAQGQWSNVDPFVHIIKLDQIHSRTHKAVFRVDRDNSKGTPDQRAKLDRKMAAIRTDLDDWIRTCPQTPKAWNKITWMYDPESAYLDARDFYGVQYHKALLFLFSVFLPTLETSDPRFITCATSAAAVCTAYKRLNQNKTLTYTMISLHSCFVAGLTLVYCIWRDRSLFSYDMLEATRDCSQSLTIFGEKWPGAVKYRDIFDALSGNLLRSVMSTGASSAPAAVPHQRHVDTQSAQPTYDQARQTEVTHGLIPAHIEQGADASMGHMVSDAVKEAFMEVDDEAPGGWQGWRMWNEMVKDNATIVLDPASRARGNAFGHTDMSWEGYDGLSTYGVDPVQDAAMQMGNYSMMGDGQWNFGGF